MAAAQIVSLLTTMIVISCCAVPGSCDSPVQPGDNGNSTSACITQLLPCHPYLNKTTSPPATCCVPLKQMVTGNTQCLCAIFNNPDILKQLNITQADALSLAKECGANADITVCKTGTPGSPAPATPSSGNTPSNAANTRNGHPLFHVGEFSFTATGFALAMSVAAIYLGGC
ncbi:hypothetical protein MLD38_032857 [Melastoma candidum]|uniref:Uncharacterized protein n=1 Tax=Melastoma candidum TaxID=119954 RepID=A0ACB9M8L0_9MYRT|nr:hypothetical protein MLD38_032857 [Melastoma candidum]